MSPLQLALIALSAALTALKGVAGIPANVLDLILVAEQAISDAVTAFSAASKLEDPSTLKDIDLLP